MRNQKQDCAAVGKANQKRGPGYRGRAAGPPPPHMNITWPLPQTITRCLPRRGALLFCPTSPPLSPSQNGSLLAFRGPSLLRSRILLWGSRMGSLTAGPSLGTLVAPAHDPGIGGPVPHLAPRSPIDCLTTYVGR
jgi:hypothetical protein